MELLLACVTILPSIRLKTPQQLTAHCLAIEYECTSTSRSEPNSLCKVSSSTRSCNHKFVLTSQLVTDHPKSRSLPYKITAEDMYDIFGKYGPIRQIRLGSTNTTRGTAYVVYDDIFDAKDAFENLNGFQVAGRYLVVSLRRITFHD